MLFFYRQVQAKAMSALLINMQLRRHMMRRQRLIEQYAILSRYTVVILRMHQKSRRRIGIDL